MLAGTSVEIRTNDAELARRLLQAAPGVRILASSREPLHVTGEAVYRVPAMPTAQAIRLFVDRARASNLG